MDLISDVVCFLAGFFVIGFTEAFIKPLAAKQVKSVVLEYVPDLLDRLDLLMPTAFGRLTEEQIRQFIIDQFTSLADTVPDAKQTEELISEVEKAYSPLVSLRKYQIKN